MIATPKNLRDARFASFDDPLSRHKPIIVLTSDVGNLKSLQEFALLLAAKVNSHVLIYESFYNSPKGQGRSKSPRTDSPKKPSPRADSPKKPSPRADSPKKPSPRADSPKTDSPRTESPKKPSPRTESPKKPSPRTDSPRTDSPKKPSPRYLSGDLTDSRGRSTSNASKHLSVKSIEFLTVETILHHLLNVSEIAPEAIVLLAIGKGIGPAAYGSKYIWEKSNKSVAGIIVVNSRYNELFDTRTDLNYCKTNLLMIHDEIKSSDYGVQLYESITCEKHGYFNHENRDHFFDETYEHMIKFLNHVIIDDNEPFTLSPIQGTPIPMSDIKKHQECTIL